MSQLNDNLIVFLMSTLKIDIKKNLTDKIPHAVTSVLIVVNFLAIVVSNAIQQIVVNSEMF